jgi:hypothetical protein
VSRGVTSRMTAATIMTIALASKVVITPRFGHLPGIVDPGATGRDALDAEGPQALVGPTLANIAPNTRTPRVPRPRLRRSSIIGSASISSQGGYGLEERGAR